MGVHRKGKFCMVLSILFVLYCYTCMYTDYNYTYKSMLFVYEFMNKIEIIFIVINECVSGL